jgi:hypothetical protein
VFPERPLADPALHAARQAVDLVLAGHAPHPALAIDRHWMLIAANNPATRLMAGVDPALLRPPINVLRFSLHPQGLAPRIVNFVQWRGHLLDRLRHQIDAVADPVLIELLSELGEYPTPDAAAAGAPAAAESYAGVAVPLQLATTAGILSLYGTTMIFGTPVDITLSELAVESFFPADAATAEALRRAAGGAR